MKNILAAALFLLTLNAGFAQVGTWQSYTDMKNVTSLAVDNGKIVAATSGGTFFYDFSTDSYEKYTIVDGLASINLTTTFVDSKGRVFLGASSGHLNMFEPELGWKTIPDIARSTSQPQRGIRVIREHNDLLYIGTDFGVTVYDVDADEFRDTFTKFGNLPLHAAVNDIYFRDNVIWVATQAGIGYADLRYENLQDPAQWRIFTSANGLPSESVNAISMFRGSMVVGTDAGLAILENDSWGSSSPPIHDKIVGLQERDGDLYVGMQYEVFKIGTDGANRYVGEFLRNGNYQSDIELRRFGILGQNFYIATNYGVGLTTEMESDRAPWTFRYPNGPNSNQFLSLSIDADGNLWSASGRDGNGKGIYKFSGDMWTNYNVANTPAIPTDNITLSAAVPNGDMWFGSWGYGLIRRDVNGAFTVYNPTTVPGFPGISSDPNYAPISGISVDRSGNVYSLHTGSTEEMVSRYSPSGTWHFFGDPAIQGGTDFSGLSIDEFGNKWISVKSQSRKGVLVFNENGTLDDQSDDTWVHLPAGGNELLAEDISSIVVDGYGDVWLGSNAGIRTVFNPQDPTRVTRTCFNTRCNIEGEAITCLAVDPVNNKWIGTNSGVFVLSNDGSTILNQFNTGNSLLLDNVITSIAIHPTTGVVYIGTSKGLSAYTTPYQQAQQSFTDLNIYPNPFKPKTDIELNIQGLVEESSVKILSISGNLVAEFTTPGGNIGFWNGKTSNGNWAPTGIYYITAYSADGKKAAVGKVAVVNE